MRSETELLLAYGNVSFASKAGPPLGNHFLTLTEGLENIYALGRKTLLDGQQDIRFELARDRGRGRLMEARFAASLRKSCRYGRKEKRHRRGGGERP